MVRPKGIPMKPEYIKKISERIKQEWKNGKRKPHKWTDKQKKKMSKIAKSKGFGKWMIGRKLSKETIEKMKKSITGEKSHLWKGGRMIDKDGYILIYCPNHPYAKKRYVREHRFVMEKYLGRYLYPKEVVHHINGIRHDNRIENLKVFLNNGFHIKEAHPETLYKKGHKISETTRKKLINSHKLFQRF